MLTAIPKYWFSWGFSLTDGNQSLADLKISALRAKGELSIADERYRVYRKSPLRGSFVLESKGTVIARANKPSVFSRRMIIEFGKERRELKPYSMFSRKFHLLSGKAVVGRLSPTRWYSRRMHIDLSEDLPLPIRTFIVWLTLMSWKRASDAGGC